MSDPKLFDIHCHLNLPEFVSDGLSVLERTLSQGCWINNVGADLISSRRAVEIADSKDWGVWATVGLHPTDALDLSPEVWSEISTLAKKPKVVAIGECGLDYFRLGENSEDVKKKQKDLFLKHLELALLVDKPLMIHCRPSVGSQDAYLDLLSILIEQKKISGDKLRGNFHFFAGDWIIAQQALSLGFTLSFTGVITFSSQYDEVIKKMPLDRLLSETDSPFVSPVPFRGQRCEPVYVLEVVRRLAELRGISFEEMAEITVYNGKRVFGLD